MTDDSTAARRRKPVFETLADTRGTRLSDGQDEISAGRPPKPGAAMGVLRIVLFGCYFFGSCLCIHASQLLGIPLYWIDRDYYYTWMAVTKQHFGLLIATMTQWWSPTTIRISGDASMQGQLHQTRDGRLESAFPERLILIANHQIYTDWLYLWWVAYTAGMHGQIYIILKQSLKWVPLLGPGMQFYSFIFMARKWASDQVRMRHRFDKLQVQHTRPDGVKYYNPMWLLIFPEGTNLSNNGRTASAKWAEKSGLKDMRHQVLPRSTGLQFCASQLQGTVEYIYDCTIGYERIPPGEYGQDIFTLRSVYFQGRTPKSVNMYWRRFKISEMPIGHQKAMEEWTLQRWREKDDLLEHFQNNGRFPGDARALTLNGKSDAAYIETEVRPKSPIEFLQIFMPLATALLVCNVLIKMVNFVTIGRFSSRSG